MRQRKITLKYFETGAPDGKPRWKVISVNNSIEPAPGEFLTKERVKDLCDLGTFEVVIVNSD